MAAPRARVAAHIGVLNEAAMIRPCIDNMRRIGATDFVVFDLNSTDGTRDILAGMEGDDLRVIDFPAGGTDKLLMEMATRAINDSPADWCVLMDADEFPMPRGGDIAAILGRSKADLIELPRYNVALGPDGLRMPLPPRGPGDHARTDLLVESAAATRAQIEADPTLAWLRVVPAPKLAVRSGRIARLARGMHNARPRPGQSLRRVRSRNIVIAHAALTDYPRFREKVASIRRTFEAYGGEMSKRFGWHWRRWVALDDAGRLREEFERSFLTAETLETLRGEGAIKSAAAWLAERAAAPALATEAERP